MHLVNHGSNTHPASAPKASPSLKQANPTQYSRGWMLILAKISGIPQVAHPETQTSIAQQQSGEIFFYLFLLVR